MSFDVCCEVSEIYFVLDQIARTWTTKAVKMFTEITHGIIFHTFFLPSSNMFKSMVALYFQQGADNSIWAGRSLSHVLMDQELGIVSPD